MRVADLKPQPQEPRPVRGPGQLVESSGGIIGISLYDKYHDSQYGKYRIVSLGGETIWSYNSWEQAGQSWKLREHGVTLENN
jgi:hypothetical protein